MMRRQREASLKIKELFSASNAVLIIHKSYIPQMCSLGYEKVSVRKDA